jgi:hypothetical protein
MGTARGVGLLTGVLSLAREPARLTLRVWELGFSSAASAAKLGLELLDPERSGSSFAGERYAPPPAPRAGGNGGPPDVLDADAPPTVPDTPPAAAEPAPAAEPPPAAFDAPRAPTDAPPAVPDELIPDHVDEEIVLVAESAETGAEDGAGAELRVVAPWDGYDRMTAPEIRGRLAAADGVLAAAVTLYETTHKGRRTVLEAAERALNG